MRNFIILTLLVFCGHNASGQEPLPLVSGLITASKYVVNRDQNAYNHALREVKLMIARGKVGHPLGCARGSNRSGTGMSYSPRPRHCFYGQISESRLIARACIRDKRGAYWWSAHYR